MINQQDRPSRRRFFKVAGVGAAASLAFQQSHLPGQAARAASDTGRRQRPFKLALASYTLRKFDIDQALAMTQRVGLPAICFKSFHLALDASPEEIAQACQKVKAAGLTLYGGGVISMKKEEDVGPAFEYAKAAGMSKIIAAPSVEMLPLINRKVQQYDIGVCIHNHGPGDKFFPTPEVAYPHIKDLDPRVGLCHDIGHTLRYGDDPIAQTETYADRILDVHMKDVTKAAKEGKSTPCGRGVIDIPAFVRTLLNINYQGYLAFEYEEDPTDPLAGLAESVGYVNGVMDTVST
jgi:sugar phosphate isomerase/epimerase